MKNAFLKQVSQLLAVEEFLKAKVVIKQAISLMILSFFTCSPSLMADSHVFSAAEQLGRTLFQAVTFTEHSCKCNAKWHCSKEPLLTGNVTPDNKQPIRSALESKAQDDCRKNLLQQLGTRCEGFGEVILGVPIFECTAAEVSGNPNFKLKSGPKSTGEELFKEGSIIYSKSDIFFPANKGMATIESFQPGPSARGCTGQIALRCEITVRRELEDRSLPSGEPLKIIKSPELFRRNKTEGAGRFENIDFDVQAQDGLKFSINCYHIATRRVAENAPIEEVIANLDKPLCSIDYKDLDLLFEEKR